MHPERAKVNQKQSGLRPRQSVEGKRQARRLPEGIGKPLGHTKETIWSIQ